MSTLGYTQKALRSFLCTLESLFRLHCNELNTTITFVLLQTSGSDDETEDEGNKLDLEAARRRIEEQDADDKEVSYLPLAISAINLFNVQ